MRTKGKGLCLSLLGLLLAVCLLGGCGEKGESAWQEQYDLGLRYLDEGNYEQAVLAFTAAIEIDPKRPEAYLKAAEAYEAMGDYEAAADILEKGYLETGDERLRSAKEESEPEPTDGDILSHAVDFGGDSLYIEHEYVFEGPIPASEDFLLFGDYDFMTMDTAAVLRLFPNASGPTNGSLTRYSGDEKIEISTTVCHEYADVYLEIENKEVQSSASTMSSTQYVGDPYLHSLDFGDRDYLLDGHETGVYGLVLGMSYSDVMEHLGFSKGGADVLAPFGNITIDSSYVSFREESSISDIYRYLSFKFSEEIGYEVQLHFNADDLLNEITYSRYDEA